MTFVPDTSYANFTPREAWPERLWRGVNAFAAHSLFQTANLFDAMRVESVERTTKVEVLKDLCYDYTLPSWCNLDIWRPVGVSALDPAPCVMFVHGGGFRTMSKSTHWMMARTFARMGYVVVTVDYRLGPMHPYPAAIEDVAKAYQWVINNGAGYGINTDQITLAGESAGGNLVHALTMGLYYPRPEAWAKPLYHCEVKPCGVIVACGLLQTSNPNRLLDYGVSRVAMIPVRDATHSYLGASSSQDVDFANPLLWIERAAPPKLPLPPFFIPVGEDDPLLSDSTRLARALERLQVPHQLQTYEGKGHSFMAFMWDSQAQRCWEDMSRFLAQTFDTSQNQTQHAA